MKKIVYIVAIILSSLIVFAEEDEELFAKIDIKNGMVLSIKDCVATAFTNSPKIKKEKYNLDIAKSNLGIAKAQYFPVIHAGIGFYNENNSNNYNHYQELPSVGITINKLVWDFGKTTAYIKMEDFYKIGAEYEFIDSLCATLFDVKEKYYNLLKAKALLQVAKNNVQINKNFVKYAKDKKQQPDLTTAELNLSEANIKYLEAQNNYKNAQIDLNNSMYLDSQVQYDIKNTYTFKYDNDYTFENYKQSNHFKPAQFDFPFDNAVQIAYDNSPDLSVLIATKEAMEQALLYIKKTYLPELTANTGYTYNNSNLSTNNSLQVGLNLSANVNLMELKHSIKGADAQLALAENEINLFKKNLYFEVKRAFNNVEKTQSQIPLAQQEVEQSITNLQLIENQYIINELNYLSLQNAGKDYVKAINEYINSLYNYNIALIKVEMAMHYHIVDIHHKSEHAMKYHSEELIEHLNKVLGCDEKESHPKRKHRL